MTLWSTQMVQSLGTCLDENSLSSRVEGQYMKTWGTYRASTSSLTIEVESVKWLAHFEWHKSHSCHHPDRFTELAAKKQIVRQDALTGTQPCTAFSCKNDSGSTTLAMPEPKQMNGQMDWQAEWTTLLVSSVAGQRCWEAWNAFYAGTDQNITALIAWRREEWRKEMADVPMVGNSLNSTRPWLILFWEQPWANSWQIRWSIYGHFRAWPNHIEMSLRLKLLLALTTGQEWPGLTVSAHMTSSHRHDMPTTAWQYVTR